MDDILGLGRTKRAVQAVRSGNMPARESADTSHGYLLKDAIKRFSDPAEWQEYVDVCHRIPKGLIVIQSSRMRHYRDDGSRPSEEAKYFARVRFTRMARKQRAGLHRKFHARLRAGTLVASGYAEPMSPDSRRIQIPAEQWEVLKINWEKSSAQAGMFRYIGVRVSDAHQPAKPDKVEIPLETKSPVGRPSHNVEVRVEFRRRAKAGNVESTLAEQCRVLAHWMNNREGKIVYQPRSLETPLRPLYNKVKPAKKRAKSATKKFHG